MSLCCDTFNLCDEVVFLWAWDRSFPSSGLSQARLSVCEAELVAGFFILVVIEQPGCGLNSSKCGPRLSSCPFEGV